MAKYKIVDIDKYDAYIEATPENRERIIGIVGEPSGLRQSGDSEWVNGSFISDKPVEITVTLDGITCLAMEKDFYFYRVKIEKVEE